MRDFKTSDEGGTSGLQRIFSAAYHRLPNPVARHLRTISRPRAATRRQRIIRHLAKRPDLTPSLSTLRELVAAWSPHGVAPAEFQREVCVRAMRSSRPVLECGTGLSTLLLAIYARAPVWCLEEGDYWAARMSAALRWYGLSNTTVLHTPVREYEGFRWYDVDLPRLPRTFELVVCDGPISSREVGHSNRFGLVPIFGDRLDGATIMLDDADRPGEQQVLRAWEDFGFGWEMPIEGRGRFAIVTSESSQPPER